MSGGSRSSTRSWSGPFLVARIQWRRRVGLLSVLTSAALMAFVGACATALAVRNNAQSEFGEGIFVGVGLIAGVSLAGLDLDLLRFRAREPGSFLALLGAFAGVTPVVVALLTPAVGVVAGLPASVAVVVGLGLGFAVFGCSTTIALHALGGSTRFPVLAAGLDLAIVTAIAVSLGPLALVWGGIRGIVLVRSARRRRWQGL